MATEAVTKATLHWRGHEMKVFGVKFSKLCSQHSLKKKKKKRFLCPQGGRIKLQTLWPSLVFWYELDLWGLGNGISYWESCEITLTQKPSTLDWNSSKGATAPLICLQSQLRGSHGDHPSANIADVLQNSNPRQMKLPVNHPPHLCLAAVSGPSRFPPSRGWRNDTIPQNRDFKTPTLFPFFFFFFISKRNIKHHIWWKDLIKLIKKIIDKQIIEKIVCTKLAALLSVIEQERFKCPIIVFFNYYNYYYCTQGMQM